MILTNIVECSECGAEFEVEYAAGEGVDDVQDLTDAPSARVVCPDCGHAWEREWEGWIEHQSAG